VWPYLALSLFSLVAVAPLAHADLPCSDDGPFHLFRAVELGRLLQLGHWFPRWAPDMAQGYGYPFFNFYAPLSSYGVVALHALGLAYPAALKVAFALGLWLAGLATFWLARALWGERAGVAAGAAYLLAPYLAYDILFRGNLAEAFAFVWPPLVLLGLHLRQRRGWLLAALAYAALILTHNVFALVASPLFVAYLLLRAGQTRSFATLWRGGLALAAGIALTAYFWAPALAERAEVHPDRLLVPPIFTWYTNFITPADLLAAPQVEDPLLINPSPIRAIGLVPVLFGLPAVAAALWAVWKRKRNLGAGAALFFAAALVYYALLTLPISAPVWGLIKPLELVQFPWRMLGPAALCAALLVGASVPVLERGLARLGGRTNHALRGAARGATAGPFAAVLPVIFLANLGWWYPRYCATATEVGVPDLIRYEQDSHTIGTTAKGEYLPRAVGGVPADTALAEALMRGEEPDRLALFFGAEATAAQTADPLDASYTVESPADTLAIYQQLYYPGWQASVDGQPVEVRAAVAAADDATWPTADMAGLVSFNIPAGTHTVRVWFGSTPLRSAGSAVSLIALAAVMGIAVWQARRRRSEQNANGASDATATGPMTGRQVAALLIVCALLPIVKLGVIDRVPNPLRRPAFDTGALPLTGPLGQYSLQADFAGGIRLHGYDLATSRLPADGAVDVALYVSRWAASEQRYWPAFRIVDADGFTWQDPDYLPPRWQREPPPTGLWPLDEYAQWARHLTLLPGTPPGTYTLLGEVFDLDSLAIASRLDEAGNAAAPRFELGALVVDKPRLPSALTDSSETLNVRLGPLTLVGADLPRETVNAGDLMLYTLYWRSEAATPADLSARLTLKPAPDGDPVLTLDVPPVSSYATSLWQVGDAWRGPHRLHLPADLISGVYKLWVSLPGEAEQAVAGQITVHAPVRTFTAPAGLHPAGGVVEGLAVLSGYTVTPTLTQLGLTVRLVWQATATPEIGYSVFVHLQGEGGRIWAQSDGVPAGWTRPTTGWLPGEYVVDEHRLSLPADLPAGDYTLYVGLYDPQTNQRLPTSGPGATPDARLALDPLALP